jgi:sorbitol-specific phosphotransferase system component IIC
MGASPMKHKTAVTLRAFFIELVIYAVLVVGYFFAVLHFLSEWIGRLEKSHIIIYALVAIALIIVQGIVLESVTTWLMRRLQGGRSE